MRMMIPNMLTVFRIVLIPVLVLLYFWPSRYRAELVAGVFVLASLTDWLDGYMARRMNAMSRLGAVPSAGELRLSAQATDTRGQVGTSPEIGVTILPDPLTTVFGRVLDPLPFSLAVCVIIGREIVISALRELMAELGERGVVAVGILGKVKTVFHMVSIALLLYGKDILGIPVFRIGEIAFYAAAVLTLWSRWSYLRAAWVFFRDRPAGADSGGWTD